MVEGLPDPSFFSPFALYIRILCLEGGVKDSRGIYSFTYSLYYFIYVIYHPFCSPVCSCFIRVETFPFSGSVLFSSGKTPVVNPVILGVCTTRDFS
jgi:hypothetical protein